MSKVLMKNSTTNILKNLIGSIVFVSIAFAILVGISYMLRPLGYGNRHALSGFYAEEEESLDVVAIGSSAIYRFLNNPILWKEYGVTSYNLGTGNQQSEVYEMLINEVLKTQTPDIIVVETRPYVKFRDEEKERDHCFRRVSDYMNYSWDRIKYINEYTDDWEKRFNLYFDIMFYHGEWENFKLSRIQNIDNRRKTPLKGWTSVYRSVPLEAPGNYDYVQPKAIDAKQEERLLKLIEYCRERDVEILFVATPWEMTEDSMAQNRYLEQIITENGGQFLNCNEYMDEIGLDYSVDFYDTMHVNVKGAEKVTSFIGSYILEHFDMNLTHSKETKEEWDEVWRLYQSQNNG